MKTTKRSHHRSRRNGRRSATRMQDRTERIAAMESLRRSYYEARDRTDRTERAVRSRG